MTPPRFQPLAFLLAAVWCLSAPAQAQQMLLQRDYGDPGRSRLEVESVFSSGLTRGYLPVRVTIRNGTAQNRTWQLGFAVGAGWNEMTCRSSFAVAAPAGSEVTEELLVPLPSVATASSSYRQMTVTASAAGLPGASNTNSASINPSWPSIAVGKRLAERNLSRLNAELSKGSRSRGDTFGASFDPAALPADWRGYTGLDVIMIPEEDWLAAAGGARAAALEWVRLGGTLDIYTRKAIAADALDALGWTGSEQSVLPRGLGRIRAWTWDGKDLDAEATYRRCQGLPNLSRVLAEEYRSGWPLFQALDRGDSSPLLVVVLLAAFGILVGPVNLFVLAKPGQRHRLFITTPLISLAATLLMMALIFFSDGIGGSGRRVALALLEPAPEERRLYVVQEQFSNAGVLLGGAFELREPAFLTPVMIPPSRWNRLDLGSNPVAEYSLRGATWRGDWFQSRSDQGHYLQAARPTRSRVELQAPSPDGQESPRLFSSLEFAAEAFFYRDDLGLVWRAAEGPVGSGQAVALAPANYQELEEWWKKQIADFSPALHGAARDLWKQNGRFYALSRDPRAGLIDTLDAIRWKEDRVLVTGALLAAPAP